MAGTDHGELLTRFEEIFGSVVEHEVIKLILQSCEWDATTASEILLGMVDKNNLPPHVLSALTADSYVRGLARRRQPTSAKSQPEQEVGSLQSDHPMNLTQKDDDEILIANNAADTMNKSTISDSTSDTPIITVPLSASAFHDGSPSTSHQTGMEERLGANSPPYISTTMGGESEASSPSFSPLKLNKSVTSAVNLDLNASEWILAPEFVPNAFNRKASDVDEKPSLWRQGMSSRLIDAVPVSNSMSPNQNVQIKRKKKEEIIEKILHGTKLMVLMRGLPGSGKTTLAKELKGRNGIVLSTDDFFCDKHGTYVYDSSKIGEAHQWNKHRAMQRLKQGKTPIIIDNTNLQAWEMKPYVQLALQYGYDLDTLEMDTPWKLSSKELARRNVHGVPSKKIEEMKSRYERGVKLEDLIADLQGLEITQQSPSKNATAKINKANVLENNLKGIEVTTKCSPLKTKKYVIDPSAEANGTVKKLSGFDSSVKEEVTFDSDEDVIVEGYDEQIIPIPICIGNNEIYVSQVDQSSTSVSESEIKETLPDHIKIVGSAVSEVVRNQIPSKVDTIAENLDSPIDLTLAVQISGLKDAEERKYNEMLDSTDHSGDEPDITCTNELESRTHFYDEKKIQTLLDEACKSIDITKSEEEWDNLTSQIVGEDFTDEKFNDLVTSFGSALKMQIENRSSIGISETKDCSVTCDTISEDFAMYDFCSTMEGKTGKPLSALVSKLAKNENSIGNNSIQSVGEPNKEDKECNFSHNDDSQANNLPRNLVLKEEKHTNSHSSSTEESSKLSNNKQEPVTVKPTPDKGEEKNDSKHTQDLSCEKTTATDCHNPDELSKSASQDTTHMQQHNESLTSWECIDIDSGLSSATWDSKSDIKGSDTNVQISKSSRTQRNRMPGDPSRWLNETDTQSESINDAVSSWVAVEGGTPEWDIHNPTQACTSEPSPSKSVAPSSKYHTDKEPQSRTGAISKLKKSKRHNNSPSANIDGCKKGDEQTNDCKTVTVHEGTNTIFESAGTQTLSIDFEALELDHSLYELKVLFGQPHYVPVTTISSSFSEKGPLTKGGLRLDKGTMTDDLYENSVVSSFINLVAFFPNIPKEDLRDVFEKCKHDSDWAMNVLLDSGYEMSDPNDMAKDLTDADIETDSVGETTNTDDGKNDLSSSDTCDIASDSFSEEKTRKIKQSQLPEDLAKKIEIEKSFEFSESVDDRVLRLTGKQYNDLSMTKVKKNKGRKQHGKRNGSPSNIESKEIVEEEGEGAQYITLVMDPLFTSQLNMLFGPVGDCEISGDLTPEDRSVVLPLEICELIHRYWARTVDGKFNHEAEILDSLVCQDEILARKLQEEENAAINLSEKRDDVGNDGLPEDQPICFQEIMDLEQALQESLANRTPEDTSISSQLNLKRLYKEYPHVDPVALREEYTRNGCKYPITVERLNQRYGKEQGTPKTVIAPEALIRYEQEMIERAQQSSLEEQELATSSTQHREIVPDDPQVYRDEAQSHYHQRQEAFQKAQEAFRQGMKAAAAYYAHIGNLHSQKLREANQRASQKILEAKNAHRKDANCLDLHLLHVPEAISATQAFLHERQRVLIARGIRQMEVSLITGRGFHSAGGQAVLKPSIKEHLQKHGYSFYEVNSGMLKVILHSKPS